MKSQKSLGPGKVQRLGRPNIDRAYSESRDSARYSRNPFLDGNILSLVFQPGLFAKPEQISDLRNRLLKEFAILLPSQEMLTDMIISSYIKFEVATKAELELLLYERDEDEKIGKIVTMSLYCNRALNQFLKVLQSLQRETQSPYPEPKTKLAANMMRYGNQVLNVLIEKMGDDKTIEIRPKQIALELVKGGKVDHHSLSAAEVGYLLRLWRFSKIHSREGNVYSIERNQILKLVKS